MQASNGCVQNGATSNANGTSQNGHADGAGDSIGAPVQLNSTNQDIVRLIGQYLKNEGLE